MHIWIAAIGIRGLASRLERAFQDLQEEVSRNLEGATADEPVLQEVYARCSTE
jgi:hypothetical protein